MKAKGKISNKNFWPGLIEQYRSYLPVSKNTPVVSLQEGNTPLIYSKKLSKISGMDIFLKYEGANPTGSFKDRGMTVAVSKAKEKKAKAVLCASTGNTSASAAAYAARANIPCFVLLPEGAVALGKLSQAIMCHAKVIAIKGNFDDALSIAKEITAKHPIALVNSLNPDRIEGQKTGAFEICDQLGFAPDYHFIPVGNAGNITAYWKGYKTYRSPKKIKALPKMMGFQAKGASPIVVGRPIAKPKTFATAIRIGNPASWLEAEKAKHESNGVVDSVTDAEIFNAYQWLAKEEGIFVEPASAASVAGLIKYSKKPSYKKEFKKSSRKKVAVCILTGHGLKDPSSALKKVKSPKTIAANTDKVLKEIL